MATRFAALAVDQLSDSDEDLAPPPAPATSLSPSSAGAVPGQSKKAAARKRAQLRKKGSQSNLNTPDDSDASPSARTLPPVPSFPTPSSSSASTSTSTTTAAASNKAKTNGTKEKISPAAVSESVSKSAVAAVEKVQKVAEDVQDKAVAAAKQAAAAAPAVPKVLVSDTAAAAADTTIESDSDAESVPTGYDEEEDDESDSEEANSTLLPPAEPKATSAEKPSVLAPVPSPKPPGVVYTGADHDPNKKIKAIITRTIFGFAMIGSLVGIVAMGHIYVIVLVFICQAAVFAELTALFDAGYSSGHVADDAGVVHRSKEKEERRRGRREERDRWSRRMSWYFFAATNYFLYGESLIYYFKHILTLQATFLPTTFSFAQHHRLISFGLYIIGFVSFVANLSRNNLRRQFGLFGWIHMSLLLIVVSSHFIVNNILEGLIWFWQPVSLVVMNDIAAYVCGMLFGRHQLIKLSPKKTVEGFVGAIIITIIFAIGWGTLFMRFDYFICPVKDLATNVFSDMHCSPNHVFVWRDFILPAWAQSAIATLTTKQVTSIPWVPFQLHSIVMAIFASLVAPFGGFFASGFKRAFNIKDFGASIPGHGGMTDRMDCQFLMGLFSYVYYASLIRETHITVGTVLATVAALTTEQQIEVLTELTKTLGKRGIHAIAP